MTINTKANIRTSQKKYKNFHPMEFFKTAGAIRLKSHLGKYLTADDDQLTVRQSRNGLWRRARWTVEFVQENPHVIRLKACNGGYLMASNEALMLGLTGKKVLQSDPGAMKDGLIEWEPSKERFGVKLRTRGGKYLRANGATPPWRNSVTHDLPHRTATQDWIMWDVDVIDISMLQDQYLTSNASSQPSFQSAEIRAPTGSNWDSSEAADHKRWPYIVPDRSSHGSPRKQGGMEFFDKAKVVRLQGHFGKYLVADDDELTVCQSRKGSSRRARWTVEFVSGECNSNKIRLKSCDGFYLTASSESFLLGMTSKKVIQTRMEKLTDASIEWEPVKEGLQVKLVTRGGKFLTANGGIYPWKNSVTHGVPHRETSQNWVLWGVDVLDITPADSDMDSGSLSPASGFNSLVDDFSGSRDTRSPIGRACRKSSKMSGFGSIDGIPSSPDTVSPIARDCVKYGKIPGFGESVTELSKVRYSQLSGNMSTNQMVSDDEYNPEWASSEGSQAELGLHQALAEFMVGNTAKVEGQPGGICRQFDCVRRTVISCSGSQANPERLYHRCSIHGWSSWCTQDEEKSYIADDMLEEQKVDHAEPNTNERRNEYTNPRRNEQEQARTEDPYEGLRQLISLNLVLLTVYLFYLIMKCIF